MPNRKIIFLALLLFLFNNLNAQYEFSTALKIQTSKAGIESSSLPGIKELKNFIRNPFAEKTNPVLIKAELQKFISAQTSDSAKSVEGGITGMPTPHGLISSVAGILNPALAGSEIIYAVTDVLVERAKEEIAAAYFDRIAIKFETPVEISFDGVPVALVLKDLFPNFYLLAKNIRMNLNMQTGAVFLSAFEKDITGFYDNADRYLIPVEFKSKMTYTVMNSFYGIVKGLRENTHPAFVLRKIMPPEISEKSNFALHLLNIAGGISESILNAQTENYGGVWIGRSDLRQLNAEGFAYYLSLLYFNANNIVSFNGLGLDLVKIFNEKSADMIRVVDAINSVISRFIEIQNSQENSSPGYANGESKKTADTGSLIAGELLNVLKDIYGVDLIRNHLTEQQKEIIDAGFNTAQYIRDFYSSLKNKNYGSAVLAVLSIINQYSGEEKINAEIVKYLTLAADICQAESTEAASKIFEAAILPPGSYRLKRTSAFSSSVSAFTGIGSGFEWLDKGNLKAAVFISPFLPIGIDLTWSTGDDEEQCDSKSVFFSLIDLGTVAGYRFKNSGDENLKAENVPPVKFQHIISPGVFFVYGFRDSPFAAGAGLQYSPRLRSITDAQNIEVAKASALRALLFVAIDIPLFNLIIK